MNRIHTVNINKPFYLNGYLIDPKKGEVLHCDKVTSLEPKVMQVLLLLVERHTELVNQEEIFAKVWPDAVINPSSIQRCIALLRKIFNDDAKRQTTIKTHPKRGYSLHAELNNKKSTSHQSFVNLKNGLLYGTALTLTVLVFFYLYTISTKYPKFNFIELTPLSSTENNEFEAQFSPDLKYVAYIHEEDESRSQIRLRNNSSEEHFNLTHEDSQKLSFSWASDSRTLVYAQMPTQKILDVNKSVNSLDSGAEISINRISVESAGEEAQDSELLTTLEDVYYISNICLSDNNVLFYIESTSNERKVVRHDLTTGKRKQLTSPFLDKFFKNSLPEFLALSNDAKTLAIIGKNNQLTSQIAIVDVRGELVRLISFNDSSKLHEVSWHSDNQTLLLNNGRQLSFLFDDEITKKINFSSRSQISDARIVDKKNITVTLDRVDTDIYQYELRPKTKDSAGLSKVVVNSNRVDSSAKISPEGNKLAFVSNRAGYPQLLIKDNQVESVIFRNDKKSSEVNDYLWANEMLLYVSIDGDLYEFDLEENKQTALNLKGVVTRLFYWSPKEKVIFLESVIGNNIKIGKYSVLDETLSLSHQTSAGQKANLIANSDLVILEKNKISLVESSGTKRLLHDAGTNMIAQYLNSSSGLYYQARKGNANQLWHLSYPNIQVTKVLDLPLNHELVDVSQDEHFAVFRSTTHEKDIVVIKSD